MTELGYKKYFTESSFKDKIRNGATKAGSKVVYAALLLYHMMKDPATPVKAKVTIAAALGYFILPTDAIPDIAPLFGFSDDLGVLLFALNLISDHITPEVKGKATRQLQQLFKNLDDKDIQEVENSVS